MTGSILNYNILKQIQFQRENNMSRNWYYGTVAILGVGGIGSHVAMILSSVKELTNLYLIDPDKVELSNLGRTDFNYYHIDKLKVESIAEMIISKRLDINVIPIPKLFNRELLDDKQYLNMDRIDLWIDCRDDYYADYDIIRELSPYSQILRSAYNGHSITIDMNPEIHPVWGQGGYTEVMSNSSSARTAALLVVYAAINLNASNIIKRPITFNSLDILDMLALSQDIMCMDLEDRKKIRDIYYNKYHDEPPLLGE